MTQKSLQEIFSIHQNIGIDIDEVLASTSLGVLHVAHSKGMALQWKTFDDMREYDFFEDALLDMKPEDSIQLWDEYWHLDSGPANAPVIEGAKEGVARLDAMKKNLFSITARDATHALKFRGTYSWMQTHFPSIPQAHIFFANHFSESGVPKSLICRAHNITLIIDDSIQNAMDATEHGIVCVLLEKPWNKDKHYSHPLLYRVRGWHDIISVLP